MKMNEFGKKQLQRKIETVKKSNYSKIETAELVGMIEAFVSFDFDDSPTKTGNNSKTKAKFDRNGKLIRDALGRTEFDFIHRYRDGSTKTTKDNIYILTEKDGTLFKDVKGRTKFDYIRRSLDGSTETGEDNIRILTEKEGSLFKDAEGNTEFDNIYRFGEGTTKTVKNGREIFTKKQ